MSSAISVDFQYANRIEYAKKPPRHGSQTATDLVTAIHEAGHIVAAKQCLRSTYRVRITPLQAFVVGDPPYFPSFVSHLSEAVTWEPSHVREDTQRHWVTTFAGTIAEHRFTGEDIADVLRNGGASDRAKMEVLSDFLSADPHERYSVKHLTEAIVNCNWQIVKSLADEIQQFTPVSTKHRFLSGVPFITDWSRALKNPWS